MSDSTSRIEGRLDCIEARWIASSIGLKFRAMGAVCTKQ
jgi:hypothetical protein